MCQELTPEEQSKKDIDKSMKETFGLQSRANLQGCKVTHSTFHVHKGMRV